MSNKRPGLSQAVWKMCGSIDERNMFLAHMIGTPCVRIHTRTYVCMYIHVCRQAYGVRLGCISSSALPHVCFSCLASPPATCNHGTGNRPDVPRPIPFGNRTLCAQSRVLHRSYQHVFAIIEGSARTRRYFAVATKRKYTKSRRLE